MNKEFFLGALVAIALLLLWRKEHQGMQMLQGFGPAPMPMPDQQPIAGPCGSGPCGPSVIDMAHDPYSSAASPAYQASFAPAALPSVGAPAAQASQGLSYRGQGTISPTAGSPMGGTGVPVRVSSYMATPAVVSRQIGVFAQPVSTLARVPSSYASGPVGSTTSVKATSTTAQLGQPSNVVNNYRNLGTGNLGVKYGGATYYQSGSRFVLNG